MSRYEAVKQVAFACCHGDAHGLLVYRFFKKDRPALFELAGKLRLKATSSDDSVLAALAHAREHSPKRRDFIPLPPPVEEDEPEPGIAFASDNWRRAVTDRRRPGMVARRHFEAMVFIYLAEELRTGDMAVFGSNEYADWGAHLLSWGNASRAWRVFARRSGFPTPRPASSPPEGRPPGHGRTPGRRVSRQRRSGHRRGRGAPLKRRRGKRANAEAEAGGGDRAAHARRSLLGSSRALRTG